MSGGMVMSTDEGVKSLKIFRGQYLRATSAAEQMLTAILDNDDLSFSTVGSDSAEWDRLAEAWLCSVIPVPIHKTSLGWIREQVVLQERFISDVYTVFYSKKVAPGDDLVLRQVPSGWQVTLQSPVAPDQWFRCTYTAEKLSEAHLRAQAVLRRNLTV